MVKALDLRSNGRIVRVGSNPTPGKFFIFFFFLASFFLFSFLFILSFYLHLLISEVNNLQFAPNQHKFVLASLDLVR